jgi:hypothetical protein
VSPTTAKATGEKVGAVGFSAAAKRVETPDTVASVAAAPSFRKDLRGSMQGF